VPIKYATGVRALVKTLKLDHEVEWRAVTPGEDLREYHKVLVVLGPPNALTAQYTFGAMWCLGRDPDTVDLVLDDHQTHQVLSGFKTVDRDRNRLWKPILNRKGRAEVEADPSIREVIETSVATLANSARWPWKVWAPMYPVRRADPEKLGLPVNEWKLFDPTVWWFHKNAYLARHATVILEDRERTWVSASLLDKSPWLQKQRRTWETIYLGNRKQGQARLQEERVLQLYGACWGMLSCPHRHAGSGWWRARFTFASLMGAVTYCDPREAALLGSCYELQSPAQVEGLSAEELWKLAGDQSAQLANNAMNFEQLREHVNREIDR
jgi:hypothetical protein